MTYRRANTNDADLVGIQGGRGGLLALLCRAKGQNHIARRGALFVAAWFNNGVGNKGAFGLKPKSELKGTAAHGFCWNHKVTLVRSFLRRKATNRVFHSHEWDVADRAHDVRRVCPTGFWVGHQRVGP